MKRRAEQMDASAGPMSTKSAQLCSTMKNTNNLTLNIQTLNIQTLKHLTLQHKQLPIKH